METFFTKEKCPESATLPLPLSISKEEAKAEHLTFQSGF